MSGLLGLDFGSKRIGIAHTDEEGRMAFPLKTVEIRGMKHLIEILTPLIEQYKVKTIVVGLPKTLNNEEGIAAEKVRSNVEWLKTQIPVRWELWDERLTSKEIERVLSEADVTHSRRNEFRDKLAAQRILQNYLDFKQNS